jgi:hypothetical protein
MQKNKKKISIIVPKSPKAFSEILCFSVSAQKPSTLKNQRNDPELQGIPFPFFVPCHS